MNIYIYVDDIREDDTWFNKNLSSRFWRAMVCRNAAQAIDVLRIYGGRANIIIDLDHDLGEGNEMDDNAVPNGYDICKYIVENQIPLVGFHIHSMNPIGVANMRQLLTYYGYEEM